MRIPVIGLSFPSRGFLEKLANLLNKDFEDLRFHFEGTKKIPDEALNKFREQYLAERILDFLREKSVSVWITEKALYSKGTNYVFGESEYRGPIIVSIKRLRPEFYENDPDSDLLLSRLRKEIAHELGHCFGLDDCDNPSCVMKYSNSIKAIDRKKDGFCEECEVNISAQGLPLG